MPSFGLFRTFPHMYHAARTFNSKGSFIKISLISRLKLNKRNIWTPLYLTIHGSLPSYDLWVNWMERTDRTGVTITSFLQLIKRGSMVEVVLGFFFGVALFRGLDLLFWLRSVSSRNRSSIIAFIFAWY